MFQRRTAPNNVTKMMRGIVVLLGNPPIGRLSLETIAQEFGWALQSATSFDYLRKMPNVIAVLLDPATLGISASQAVRAVQDAAPKALPIVCHRFSDVIDWPKLAAEGAFHSVLMPFDRGEVRQSLGFVWAAKRQRPGTLHSIGDPLPIAKVGARRTQTQALAALIGA